MICSRLAILGPGLLGASIAKAVRARQPDCRIAVWARRETAVAEMLRGGWADTGATEVAAVVRDADLVVLGVPVGAMPELARQIRPGLAPGAVVTDVGSVKGAVVAELEAIFHESEAAFVGSHPMAGSEHAGMEFSTADLFVGSICMVTPTAASDPAAVERVSEFWTMLGCTMTQLSPDAHDAAVGLISHLPHLAAAALLEAIRATNASAFPLAGNGLRDATRIASGPPAMWSEILCENREAVRHGLHAMIEKLTEAERLLAHRAELEEFLTAAKDLRDGLGQKRTKKENTQPHV